MKDVSQITALVFDHGLFLPLAERIARDGGYKRVLYHTPWEEGFPTLNRCIIGDGLERVERCDDIWEVKDDVDLFIFPDIHHAGLQLELESQGKAVWGSRHGDSLEISREKFHKTLDKLGLDVPPHRVVKGVTNLRLFLMENEGPFFIKISKYRGDLETTKFRSWEEDQGLLDSWSVKFGPAKELIEFMICDPIDTELEFGGDTYCVDGQFPNRMINGYEWKDHGYLGVMTDRDDMPDQIQEVLSAFGPELSKYRYRNAWSMEGRESYFIDPCCRWSAPGTASRLELFDNLPEIILAGAHGELIEPEEKAQFAAECILTMKSRKHDWGCSVIPESLRQWVKLGGCCEIKGRTCFPPDGSNEEAIGWLCAIGNTIEETIDTLHGYADALPDGIEADTDALVGLLKEIREGEKQGIEFSDQPIPEPETALNL